MNQGWMIPIGLMEVLPGDTFQHSTSALIRVSPLLAPVMHPVHVRIHHWFVPHRLTWDNFNEFITGGPDNDDPHTFPTVQLSAGDWSTPFTMADYFGIADPGSYTFDVSALPFRAYNLIFNEYYRDQDLQAEASVVTTDGVDSSTSRLLKQICWERDRFTMARPWEQKGTQVSIPIETDGTVPTLTGGGVTNATLVNDTTTINKLQAAGASSNGTMIWGDNSGFRVDPNDLREAMALQRFAENRARFGSRYTEYLASLGVKCSDARLQRPEFLGGGKQTIQFSEVLQTAPDTTSGTTDPTGVGDLKGHGIGALKSNKYRKFFEEHGYVISIMSVKPKTVYSQGCPRHFFKTTKEEYWQKELEHIGSQPIYNKEVYTPHTTPDGTFGYCDRYDDYRRIESDVSGEFRDGAGLDYWHMARAFSTDPTLNSSFVESTPTDRDWETSDSILL